MRKSKRLVVLTFVMIMLAVSLIGLILLARKNHTDQTISMKIPDGYVEEPRISPTVKPTAEATITTSDKKEVNNSFDLQSWIGDYSYSEYSPPDENMFYSISIYRENEDYYADITIDGFQTMNHLRTKVIGDEKYIDFVFDKYLPDNTFEPYSNGDVLLSFNKDKSELNTIWVKMQPMILNTPTESICFSIQNLDSTSEITKHPVISEVPNADDSACVVTSEPKTIETIRTKDFAVTDGKNIITLDMPYNTDFDIGYEEKKSDNNYVGETTSGNVTYKNYSHEFDDFTIYDSNAYYDTKNRDFDEYYITQISLNTPNFKTLRGITIGATVGEVVNLYGEGKKIDNDGNVSLSYRFKDMQLSFYFGKDQKVQNIILSIVVE